MKSHLNLTIVFKAQFCKDHSWSDFNKK